MTEILSIELFFQGFILCVFLGFSLYILHRDETIFLKSSSNDEYIKSIEKTFIDFFKITAQIILNKSGNTQNPAPGTVVSGITSLLIFITCIYLSGTIASSTAKSWVNSDQAYQINLKELCLYNFNYPDYDVRDRDIIASRFNKKFFKEKTCPIKLSVTTTTDSIQVLPRKKKGQSIIKAESMARIRIKSYGEPDIVSPTLFHNANTKLVRRNGDTIISHYTNTEEIQYSCQDQNSIYRYLKQSVLRTPETASILSIRQKLVDYCEVFALSFFLFLVVVLVNYIILSFRLAKSYWRLIIFSVVSACPILYFSKFRGTPYVTPSLLAVTIIILGLVVFICNKTKFRLLLFSLGLMMIGFIGYMVCLRTSFVLKESLCDAVFDNYKPQNGDPKKILLLYKFNNYTRHDFE